MTTLTVKKVDAIRTTAKKVRAACLRFAMSKASIKKDYHGCEDLEMMCAVASTALAIELRKRIDPNALVVEGTFNGWPHCWVLSQGKIVDITATQFSKFRDQEVVIEGETSRLWQAKYVGEPRKIASNWGPEQAPTNQVMQKILSKVKRA